MLLIQWDNLKSRKNIEKHGVSFEEAATVLLDPDSIEFYDSKHSKDEDRFWIIGKSRDKRILLVVYSFRRSARGKENYYRIISGRIANKKERKIYES
jgi:uncharacterized DUF497 family protein